MALVDIAVPEIFTLAGGVKEFDYDHRIRSADDLIVTFVDPDESRSQAQAGFHYVVTNITATGAKFIFTDEAYTEGRRAVVERATPAIQPKNFYDAQKPTPKLTQDALNNLAMILQDVKAKADRAFLLPPEEGGENDDNPADALPYLIGARPIRANKVQCFDAQGRPVYDLTWAQVKLLAENVDSILALEAKLNELLAIHDALGHIEIVYQIREAIDLLAQGCTPWAIERVASIREDVIFVSDHIAPTYDLMALAFSEGLFGGIAQAQGLYPDEGLVDTYHFDSRDEGSFEPPFSLGEVHDEGAIV